MDVRSDWYEGWFEGDWLDELAVRPDEKTGAEVDFVSEKLELEAGARILDLACGHGRHTVELARRGHRLTGVDFSPRSLELARAAAGGLDVDFVLEDMRKIDFEGEFDAVINLFTAFGYFDAEAENQDVLTRVARALRPGGRFLIDTINGFGLAKRFQPRIWNELESGNGLFLHEAEFDFRRGRNNVRWIIIRNDGSRSELLHSLRVYAPHELVSMLEAAGLVVVGSWGDFQGSELSFDSWRLILRADKPEA
jgi:SAM-dependent methyltransferase